jgi:CxxC-x17-CxxC domain-containing protein
MMGEGEGGGAPALPLGQLIETPCWNCGKTATVPFKPDGKRPVYCMDCLKKIEAGTIIPIPERMPRVGREKFSQSLDALGIEFGSRSQQPAGIPSPRPTGGERPREPVRPFDSAQGRQTQGEPIRQAQDRQQNPQDFRNSRDRGFNRDQRPRVVPRPTSVGRDGGPVVRAQGEKSISLAQLKSKKEVEEEPSPKTSSLKDVLAEVLKPAPMKDKEQVDSKKEETLRQAPGKKDNGAGNVVNPGETIKF